MRILIYSILLISIYALSLYCMQAKDKNTLAEERSIVIKVFNKDCTHDALNKELEKKLKKMQKKEPTRFYEFLSKAQAILKEATNTQHD